MFQVIQYNNSEPSDPLNLRGHQLQLSPSDNFLIFSNAQTFPMGSPGSLGEYPVFTSTLALSIIGAM